jgi:hypothetical protein
MQVGDGPRLVKVRMARVSGRAGAGLLPSGQGLVQGKVVLRIACEVEVSHPVSS